MSLENYRPPEAVFQIIKGRVVWSTGLIFRSEGGRAFDLSATLDGVVAGFAYEAAGFQALSGRVEADQRLLGPRLLDTIYADVPGFREAAKNGMTHPDGMGFALNPDNLAEWVLTDLFEMKYTIPNKVPKIVHDGLEALRRYTTHLRSMNGQLRTAVSLLSDGCIDVDSIIIPDRDDDINVTFIFPFRADGMEVRWKDKIKFRVGFGYVPGDPARPPTYRYLDSLPGGPRRQIPQTSYES